MDRDVGLRVLKDGGDAAAAEEQEGKRKEDMAPKGTKGRKEGIPGGSLSLNWRGWLGSSGNGGWFSWHYSNGGFFLKANLKKKVKN